MAQDSRSRFVCVDTVGTVLQTGQKVADLQLTPRYSFEFVLACGQRAAGIGPYRSPVRVPEENTGGAQALAEVFV
jgi:hypothetical protein